MRITLLNRQRDSRLKLDLDPEDKVDEIMEAASDAWGQRPPVALRDGYTLLDPGNHVGDCIRDGDVVEILPDPLWLQRCRDIRHLIRHGHGRKDGYPRRRVVRPGRHGRYTGGGGESEIRRTRRKDRNG